MQVLDQTHFSPNLLARVDINWPSPVYPKWTWSVHLPQRNLINSTSAILPSSTPLVDLIKFTLSPNEPDQIHFTLRGLSLPKIEVFPNFFIPSSVFAPNGFDQIQIHICCIDFIKSTLHQMDSVKFILPTDLVNCVIRNGLKQVHLTPSGLDQIHLDKSGLAKIHLAPNGLGSSPLGAKWIWSKTSWGVVDLFFRQSGLDWIKSIWL